MKNISNETSVRKNAGSSSGDEGNISVGDGKEVRCGMVCKNDCSKNSKAPARPNNDYKTEKIGQLFENMDCPWSFVPIG